MQVSLIRSIDIRSLEFNEFKEFDAVSKYITYELVKAVVTR